MSYNVMALCRAVVLVGVFYLLMTLTQYVFARLTR